jgi:putative transposase
MIHPPRGSRRAERWLKTAQRRVSRRTKGSHRRKKAVQLLARAHQQVPRPRRDFQHKTALALVQHNDTIAHDDVRRPICSRTTTLPRASPTRAGLGS